ncbi:MAG: SDR family oxidoreductase [Rhodobacterales bacterium]|nr:SDR family oxidoreductase [Rhodobacterales bacterium]
MNDLFSLVGRRALVTGASGGLGRHMAGVLARAGAHVVVAARRADACAETVAGITAAGGAASAVALDVTNGDSVAAAVAAAGPVDILVNNAGLAVTKPLLDQEEADWDRVVDTNLKGAWLVARAVGRAMADAGTGGCMVNMASILGLRVAGGVAPYAISKAGMVQMTKVMALELARHGIRVNALAPGYVVTDLNADFLAGPAGERIRKAVPLRRFGHPEDLDGALLLLASDAGRMITGAVLPVDGGHLVSSL